MFAACALLHNLICLLLVHVFIIEKSLLFVHVLLIEYVLLLVHVWLISLLMSHVLTILFFILIHLYLHTNTSVSYMCVFSWLILPARAT